MHADIRDLRVKSSTKNTGDIITWVLFLQPLHSNVLFRKLAIAISPHRLHTWQLYGSDTSNNRSFRNWAAPCAIIQSRSISPKRSPPSLKMKKSTRLALCSKEDEVPGLYSVCQKYGKNLTPSSVSNSLHSKRFRRFFRPFEAFFAFWRRENWGERNIDGRSALSCARPNFRAFKKRKILQTCG